MTRRMRAPWVRRTDTLSWIARAALLGWFALAGWALPVARLAAEEPSALQAAVALEAAMVQAIAQSERSVVSIARVSRGGELAGGRAPAAEFPPGVFVPGAPPQPERPDPTNPDFVPNEFGTGVVVDKAGLILTNYHVVDANSDHYITTAERKVYKAKIKAADPRSDLAVLQVVEPEAGSQDFVPIKMGDGRAVRKGQIVIVLGNPYAIARDGQASATWGIVSNVARKAASANAASRTTLPQLGTLIETDARLDLGTSGGAMLNLKGEMIGLTTSLAATSGYEQAAGFAIPVDDTFRRVVETLKSGQEVKYGVLGITPQNLASGEVHQGRHGARIAMVRPGTPAHRAGIVVGDVVTHVNEAEVLDSDGLRLNIGKLAPGEEALVTFDRNGQTLSERVVLAKYHVDGKQIVTVREPDWRGLRVDEIVPMAAPLFFDDFVGVTVREVAENSPAFKAGLRVGMMITHVDQTAVDTQLAFQREVAAKTGPVDLLVRISTVETQTVTVPAN